MQDNLERIPFDLRSIFYDHRAAVDRFTRDDRRPSRLIFRDLHLPLILLTPLFFLLSPIRIFSGGSLFPISLLYPSILMIPGILLAMTFDRLSENADGPRTEHPEYPDRKNVALFLHLPLSASGIFFFLHPAAGYLMLFLSFVLSILLSIDALAWIHERSRIRSINLYLLATFLFLIPILLFLLLSNIFMSLEILQDLTIL